MQPWHSIYRQNDIFLVNGRLVTSLTYTTGIASCEFTRLNAWILRTLMYNIFFWSISSRYIVVHQDRLGEGTMDVYVEMDRCRNGYLVRFVTFVQVSARLRFILHNDPITIPCGESIWQLRSLP